MNKAIFVTALAAVMVQANPVWAEKLDPKWSEHRETADRLGLLAKQGDEDAFKELKSISAAANWPAKHTLGWLFEVGFPGQPADKEKACEYYGSAALFDYPPGMHAFAMCQFVKSSGPGSGDQYEEEAMGLLSDAASGGWTASVIYLSEYIFNASPVPMAFASNVYKMVQWGLQTDPTLTQKKTLSYLLGMAVIHGAAEFDPYYRLGIYRDGEEAMRIVVSYGHDGAAQALPKIRSMWAQAIIQEAALWKPPDESAQYCVDSIQDQDLKRWVSEKCRVQYLESRNKVQYLKRYAEYLLKHLSDAESSNVVDGMNKLNETSEKFRSEFPQWENEFVHAYVKREGEGEWP